MARLQKGNGGAPAPAPAASPADSSLLQSEQPVPERAAPKDRAVTWTNGPRGPQPNFVTKGGLDESVYGWCDVMYDMMRKKAVSEIGKEDEKKKEAAAKPA